MKILVVDDEALLVKGIRFNLQNEGYDVITGSDGLDAVRLVQEQSPDLLVLDVMMPNMDGFTLLKELPKEKHIPTIITSARSEEYDKLTGFDLGIDDYITKPFSPKELIARIKAVLNRTNNNTSIYTYKSLEINYLAHTIKIDNKIINVTPKEYEVLTYLIKNKNIAISREQLLYNVWGYDYYGDDRTIDTHIKMLRNNLGKYRNLIITVRSIGYKYVEDQE